MSKQLLLLSILFTFFHHSAKAKLDSTELVKSKWSISALLVNQSSDFNNYQNFVNVFNGIVVTRDFNVVGTRLGVENTTKLYQFGNINKCRDCVLKSGPQNEWMVRMGVQKSLWQIGKFKNYFAIDLASSYIKSEFDFIGDIRPGKEVRKTMGFGVLPSLGFQYQWSHRLGLTLETRGRLMQQFNHIDKYDANNPLLIVDSRKTQNVFQTYEPVGVFAVTINLGNN